MNPESKKILEWELGLDSSDLRSHGWYHGPISREHAESLTKEDGQFLVRDCMSKNRSLVLSCFWRGRALHFVVASHKLQPNTIYEREVFQFEGDSFDSVPNLITYYVGNRCPITITSGAIISRPVPRTSPLTSSLNGETNKPIPPNTLSISTSRRSLASDRSPSMQRGLLRVGSDPMLSPSMERRPLEIRPNSGQLVSDSLTAAIKDGPPPKPSRVPSKKWDEKPQVVQRHSSVESEHDYCEPCEDESPMSTPTKDKVTRKASGETSTIFLDASSPTTPQASVFQLESFESILLPTDNKPLDPLAVSKVQEVLVTYGPRTLASLLTRADIEALRYNGPGPCGLEMLLLPEGVHIRRDALERTQCLSTLVAATVLLGAKPCDRAMTLHRWIQIALETKTSLGNLYGFTGLVLGLASPHVTRLHATWLALRHYHTQSALYLEARLRPGLHAMQDCTSAQAPNTSVPFLHTLLQLCADQPAALDSMDLGLLVSHLEYGRTLPGQIPMLRRNARANPPPSACSQAAADFFRTEFHQRFLWGCRGAFVDPDQRHAKFDQVLRVMSLRCEP